MARANSRNVPCCRGAPVSCCSAADRVLMSSWALAVVTFAAARSLVMLIEGPSSSIRLAAWSAPSADCGITMKAPPPGIAGVDWSSPATRTRSPGMPSWAKMALAPGAARSAAACGDASTGVRPLLPPAAPSRAGLTGGKTIDDVTRAA